QVTHLIRSGGMIDGVLVRDMEKGFDHRIQGRVVINATGVFTDNILKMENPGAKPIIIPSQGIHLVLDKEFLPGESAVMVPQTADGRVLFAVPWHDRVVVGTTDTEVAEAELEPKPLEEEIQYLLEHAALYLSRDPERGDVKSVFAGLRPLVKAKDVESTASISRDHSLVVSKSGLVTITGGKWTTYRKMAEETVDQALLVAGLEERETVTKTLRIHGWLKHVERQDPLHSYGSDGLHIKKLAQVDPELGEKLHPDLPYIKAEVVWAVREEMARSVEDVLARRSRALLLDARASLDMAPETARIMARELGRDEAWQRAQVEDFRKLAAAYIPRPSEEYSRY
ncbi:MAG: FAD-dependent oxidoreductase, partial [Desulfohalobiaceae bacterium]|nr:FAD-dependent oxidoreductase [Desulfohalobiaceae bacterium]